MFVRFTGGGIGHQNTALATRIFREALLKLFDLNFNDNPSNDQNINDPGPDDGVERGDAREDDSEEWEDIQSESDIDEDCDLDSTDFEDDGGECGADEEDELGFGSF
jgi:hypothetical protein